MFCSQCGRPLAPDARFCSACGAERVLSTESTPRQIFRPRYPRLIAGVCSGFALHYGWDVVLTRVLFAVITLFTSGIGILVYIAAWVILPDALYMLPADIAYPNPGVPPAR